jgi:hypothetical protein
MDILFELFIYSLYGAGAFLFWIGKGCKTNFSDELSKKYELRNAVATICLLAIAVFAVIKVNN